MAKGSKKRGKKGAGPPQDDTVPVARAFEPTTSRKKRRALLQKDADDALHAMEQRADNSGDESEDHDVAVDDLNDRILKLQETASGKAAPFDWAEDDEGSGSDDSAEDESAEEGDGTRPITRAEYDKLSDIVGVLSDDVRHVKTMAKNLIDTVSNVTSLVESTFTDEGTEDKRNKFNDAGEKGKPGKRSKRGADGGSDKRTAPTERGAGAANDYIKDVNLSDKAVCRKYDRCVKCGFYSKVGKLEGHDCHPDMLSGRLENVRERLRAGDNPNHFPRVPFRGSR